MGRTYTVEERKIIIAMKATHSAQEVAKQFPGMTRNAVIGIWNRPHLAEPKDEAAP
jgi:hypothetical protein